jgi:hypothetical protein
MGSAKSIFRNTQVSAKQAKSYKEIPFPNPSNIQRRIVPKEELEAFQTEEVEIVANMHKLMKQHYEIQENENASQEKGTNCQLFFSFSSHHAPGVYIEPTLEEKIAMAKVAQFAIFFFFCLQSKWLR